MATKTTAYAFDMEKLPRELARTETVAGAPGNVERFSPLRALATNLSRRGVAQAKVELMNNAVATACDLCLECDPDGRPANVDHITGAVLVPLPWGEAGYKMWGLRVTECRQLRYILRRRAEHDRPPLFDYDPQMRRWVFSSFWTRNTAAGYLRASPLTLAEYRRAWDATNTRWAAEHLQG
jgi:hypothetical protein